MTDVASQGPAAGQEDRAVLTNRQGHPVYDNQTQRTVGDRGPATELGRLANLGKNGVRDVSGLTMTHSVPNEHVVVGR
jgi:hypothetical protein